MTAGMVPALLEWETAQTRLHHSSIEWLRKSLASFPSMLEKLMSAGKSSRKMALGLGEDFGERQPPAFPFLHVLLHLRPSPGTSPSVLGWAGHRSPPVLSETPSPRSEQAALPGGLALCPSGNCSGAGQLYKGWRNISHCCNKGLSNNQGTGPGHGHPQGLKIKGWITQSSLSLSTP